MNLALSSGTAAVLIAVALGSCTPAKARTIVPRSTRALSNLTTLTRWAYAETAATARSYPAAHAPAVGRLRFLTGDAQEQPYLELRLYALRREQWVLVPLPGRPNGQEGWVPADALGAAHVVHEQLRVDRERERIVLYRGGRAIWNASVGVGRPSLPTPSGSFFVTEKLIAVGAPLYGHYALGTSAYAPTLTEWPGGGVVGIHGTDEPQLIPGRPSHGCVRLRNREMAQLWRRVPVGTPIEIT